MRKWTREAQLGRWRVVLRGGDQRYRFGFSRVAHDGPAWTVGLRYLIVVIYRTTIPR